MNSKSAKCKYINLYMSKTHLMVLGILFQFLFLIQKSILYAKITVSQKKNVFQNSLLNII